MADPNDFELPADFDWRTWVRRWDRMQEQYLVGRAERFAVMVRTIADTQASPRHVLDVGCGAGSLMVRLLESFPLTSVWGIDFDPTLAALARRRLAGFGDRARVVTADLREATWPGSFPAPVDAAVSATALHWFTQEQLARFYRRLAEVLRPGGMFLNADHVASDSPAVQRAWEQHREQMRRRRRLGPADDWDGFWDAYAAAVGGDVREIHHRVVGGWERGVEEGLPLAWHFDALRAAGFASVDCFWRSDCDAVYGGVRAGGGAGAP